MSNLSPVEKDKLFQKSLAIMPRQGLETLAYEFLLPQAEGAFKLSSDSYIRRELDTKYSERMRRRVGQILMGFLH